LTQTAIFTILKLHARKVLIVLAQVLFASRMNKFKSFKVLVLLFQSHTLNWCKD